MRACIHGMSNPARPTPTPQSQSHSVIPQSDPIRHSSGHPTKQHRIGYKATCSSPNLCSRQPQREECHPGTETPLSSPRTLTQCNNGKETAEQEALRSPGYEDEDDDRPMELEGVTELERKFSKLLWAIERGDKKECITYLSLLSYIADDDIFPYICVLIVHQKFSSRSKRPVHSL